MIMKNDKKKIGFSPTKKMFSAAAMLAVSASMLATSTYAWFSMNTQVTATGMQVKAQAEGGIVISNVNQTAWTAEASDTIDSVTALYPTSTANATDWYHNKSADSSSAAAYQAEDTYETLTLKNSVASSGTKPSYGVGYVDADGGNNPADGDFDNGESAYYLLNYFYIKSSGDTLSNTNLYINNVTVTAGTGASLNALDCSLRVAVVIDNNPAVIYAPVQSVTSGTGETAQTFYPTGTYNVKHSNTPTVVKNPTAGETGYYGNQTTVSSAAYAAGKNLATGVTTISNTTPTVAKVYVYFEGEDLNCKSDNVQAVTLNDLTVSVKFGTIAAT
jgi:hypothetical protein